MKKTNDISRTGNYSILQFVLTTFTCLLITVNLSFASEPVNPKGDKWIKYSTDEGKAKIKFPYQYEVTEEKTETGKTVKVQAKKGDNMFFFAYTLHNTEMVDRENLAEVSIESFAETLKAEIKHQEEFVLKGHKGVKAKIIMKEPEANVYYRAIIVGQIQYQLIVLDVSKTIDEERDKFLKSFKIVN